MINSQIFEFIIKIIAPFLLAFSITFGTSRKFLNDKIASVIGFSMGAFFIYYQNYVTISQAFGALVVYMLLALFVISMTYSLITGKKMNLSSGFGTVFVVILLLASFYVFGPKLFGFSSMNKMQSIASNVFNYITYSDVIVLIIFLALFIFAVSMAKTKKEGKSVGEVLKDVIKESLGIK